MDDLITIIVPVYNARGYIDRCIASIKGQTYPALQIILVDDGSTDGSGDICKAYAGQDERIEVIRRISGGASAARNTGLDRARGAWIAFADADDFVSPYYIEDMFKAASDGCDMVICRTAWVEDDPDIDIREPFRRDGGSSRITGREACKRNFGKDVSLFNSVWGKLFRVSLWQGLRFPEGKICEDMYISHSLLYRTGDITILNAVLYAYVQSKGSVMRCAFTLQRLDVLDAWQEGVSFFSGAGEPELAKIAKRVYCSRVFDALYVCKKMIPGEREVMSRLRLRAADAYSELKPFSGYADCSKLRALAYRLKLFLGRWCPPLYGLMFMRGRTYI